MFASRILSVEVNTQAAHKHFVGHCRKIHSSMSGRGRGGGRWGPNSQQRGIGGGGGRQQQGRRGTGTGQHRGGGRSGGRGGEQRWWDPVWRAEHLSQKRGKVEKLNENEWWQKIEEFKSQDEQEIIIKRNYGREGNCILNDMAQKMGVFFHAYIYGTSQILVLSKIPLPNYRADLDERHGSAQREIRMSTVTEARVENLLEVAKGTSISERTVEASSQNKLNLGDASSSQEYNSAMKCDAEMKNRWQHAHALKDSSSFKAMKSFREKLPAYKRKDDFLQGVANNQVIVVSGETGCGKTTQLPQFILEDQIESLNGPQCNIICTQPRRISAMSVAARVASERGENLGEIIGYQIRLESRQSMETRLLFCTTGILLRHLMDEPDLKGVSHVIVDEIHERGMNEDFLIIILRDLLPRRPDLRVILMSATINAELFSKYFGNAPMIHIPGFTFPVKDLFLEDILERTSYAIESDSKSSQSGFWRRRKQLDQKKDPMTMLFEEVDINYTFRQYSARTKESLHAWDGSNLDLGLVETCIEYICQQEGEGAILVFLTGWDEISKLLDMLKGNRLLGDPTKYLLLPLHGSMSTEYQREIFQKPPNGMRKIVIATNIAETSITIDDVVFVVDCGKTKETSYDALNKLACLTPSWTSKASAHQRRGRAGRVQPGWCYHLYPKIIYEAMPQYQSPEILRTPLEELCLQIKSLHFGSISEFLSKSLEPPETLAVQNAINLLKTIGALDEKEELTALGCHLSKLPLDPKVGKMLLMGAVFQCLEPALTIAAALAYRDPFVLPIDKKEEADEVKRSFAEDSYSDHICVLRAFESWKRAKRYDGQGRTFCWQNFLSLHTLQRMEDMRNQFCDLLTEIGFIEKSIGFQAYNQYSTDRNMISAVLCAGLFPNVVQCKKRGKRVAFFTKEDGKVEAHPASVNAFVSSLPLPYLVYREKVKTTNIFIRDSTNISDYALLMFGGSLALSRSGQGIEMLEGYLNFSASKRTMQLIQNLRAELDKLLQRKIDNPSLDMTVVGKGVVAAVIELLNSENQQQYAYKYQMQAN